MGQEVKCRCQIDGRSVDGRAYLEANHILFRGDGLRLHIDLPGVQAAASEGVLTVTWANGAARFELGPAAAKWAAKIAHPRSRLDKLGVLPAHRVGVVGRFDKDFLFELQEKSASVKPVRDANAFDLVFFAIARLDEFDRLAKLRRVMEDNGAIWTVYPKGTGKFPDAAVFEKGRASGLKDNKVMSFSETHTALRWVIPVSERGKRK